MAAGACPALVPLSELDKMALLRRVELFAGLEDETLRLVAERARETQHAPGTYIARQGEVGSGCFLIVSGQVRVVQDGREVARRGPGEVFGELSTLDRQPRIANVVAVEPTVCLSIAAWDLHRLLEQHPRLTYGLLLEVVRRLRAVRPEQH